MEPKGSFYIEPFYFNYRTKDDSNVSMPTKLAYGIGHKLEADLFFPIDYTAPTKTVESSFGYGDTVVQGKLELHKELDRFHLLAMPSLGLSFDLNIPTGHLRSAKPNVAGGSQTTNGTWNEQVNVLARKQFKPFELYLEGTEIIQNPVDVVGPYNFNNGINSVAAGTPFHVVDGNVIAFSGALEHVLQPKTGFGYIIEADAERQSDRSLLFGRATAPSFSYLNLSPELEVTWPATGRFPLTWGGGLTMAATHSWFQKQLTPMFTVTLYGNLHGSR